MRDLSRAVSRNGPLRLTSRKVKGVIEAFLSPEGHHGLDPEEVFHLREVIRSVPEAPDEPLLNVAAGAAEALAEVHGRVRQKTDDYFLARLHAKMPQSGGWLGRGSGEESWGLLTR